MKHVSRVKQYEVGKYILGDCQSCGLQEELVSQCLDRWTGYCNIAKRAWHTSVTVMILPLIYREVADEQYVVKVLTTWVI